jgi:hypothetical protein
MALSGQHPDGPILSPVKFQVGDNGVGHKRVMAESNDDLAGWGLSHVHPDEGALNHIVQVTKNGSTMPAWHE